MQIFCSIPSHFDVKEPIRIMTRLEVVTLFLLFKMDEPVELYAITGRTEDDDHAYETPHVSTGNKYENLKINTLAEDMTDPSMVSDDTTRNTNKVHNLKPDVDAAAFRKLQIAFVIVCSVLLTIIIISSLTIGVLIHKLVSLNPSHYDNKPIQYTVNLGTVKIGNFHIKMFVCFSYFCSKYRLWEHVRTEAVLTCTHNVRLGAKKRKIMYTLGTQF